MDGMEDIGCNVCGAKDGFEEDSGYYFCRSCFSQADGIMDTAVLPEDFMDKSNPNFHLSVHRLKNTQVKTENVTLLSQSEPQPSRREGYKIPKEEHNEEEPCVLNDFGVSIDVSQLSLEDLSSEIRIRYVMGIQLMIQYQCEALVEKFGVSPLICGLSGVLWMRYVAASRVFDEQWADKTFEDSEVQYKGRSEERTTQSQRSKGTFNMYGQSAVMVWFRSLRKSIPISTSLAVTFLACHVAREPILPTDIHTWSIEGKLPYLTAFIDIEKSFGPRPSACPLSPSIMFRPYKVIGSRELESQSGFVAQSIGLQLPPVNFFAIARRYLMELSLPEEKILPHATKIFEWSMPPDLWLSANPQRLPSRVCVMSIIMLTLRLLYNINGFGKWEESLSRLKTSSDQIRNGDGGECVNPVNFNTTPKKRVTTNPETKKRKNSSQCRSHKVNSKAVRGMLRIQESEFDTRDLLDNLEAVYEKTHGEHESSKDLLTYLEYCKDAVFAGLKPIVADNKEERIIEDLWNFYKHQEDTDASGKPNTIPAVEKSANNRPNRAAFASEADECRISSTPMPKQNVSKSMQCTQDEDNDFPKEKDRHTAKETAIKQMKLNMEENGFCYIPPRCKLKRFDYLHYIRKNDGGTRSYVAHADYYILLRACAQVAKVGVRYMHAGALKLEKRLSWIENRIDQSLEFVSQNPSPQSNDDDVHPSKDIGDDVDMEKDSDDDVDLPEDINDDSLDLLNFNLFV